jgi:hypothetical protein
VFGLSNIDQSFLSVVAGLIFLQYFNFPNTILLFGQVNVESQGRIEQHDPLESAPTTLTSL